MAIVQEFMYESDDKSEFLKMMKTVIQILFTPGNNENLQYHNMYCSYSKNPGYWLLMKDSSSNKDFPNRLPVITLTHHLGDDYERLAKNGEERIPMDFKSNETSTWHNKLKWKKKSYNRILDLIEKAISIEEKDFSEKFKVNGWIAEESRIDGSHGMSYKAEWKDSSPGSLYISLGYCYYSK